MSFLYLHVVKNINCTKMMDYKRTHFKLEVFDVYTAVFWMHWKRALLG